LIVGRELTSLGEVCRSDHLRELVERRGKGQSGDRTPMNGPPAIRVVFGF